MRDQPKIAHKLLDELRRADREVAKRWPNQFDPGLGRVGLILESVLKARSYFCTPTNCWTFAGTGGDGVHYSLLALGPVISDDSPVVMTLPAYGGLSWAVGENLFDFLCLGSVRGYFGIEQLAYQPETALQAFTNVAWQPTENWHFSTGLSVGADEQRLLEFLTQRFKLKPWVNPERFAELQERFGKLLELPPDMVG